MTTTLMMASNKVGRPRPQAMASRDVVRLASLHTWDAGWPFWPRHLPPPLEDLIEASDGHVDPRAVEPPLRCGHPHAPDCSGPRADLLPQLLGVPDRLLPLLLLLVPVRGVCRGIVEPDDLSMARVLLAQPLRLCAFSASCCWMLAMRSC